MKVIPAVGSPIFPNQPFRPLWRPGPLGTRKHLLPFNALWCVRSKIDISHQPQVKVYTMFAQLGANGGSPSENCPRPFANCYAHTGTDADLSSDWDGIGDLAVPYSYERPAKDRSVDL
jgi:hypothetical protein